MRVGRQQRNWGKVTALGSALGQTLQTVLTPKSPSPALPVLPMPLAGSGLPTLSAPGTGVFCGYWCLTEFLPRGSPGCRSAERRPRAARHHLSRRVFSERLARRPAAFHCCLFIRLNSLRFLSCSLRGTEGELVPADGPHPLRPALLEPGLERRDGRRRGSLPPLRGPACRLRAASQQIR